VLHNVQLLRVVLSSFLLAATALSFFLACLLNGGIPEFYVA
jgi:hypothetical protein